ncbi:MAG: hypothetical protein HRU18_16745 [Pseudoalteromonas sp.]|uniref:hypothetical protein n=1 Tax=Pseudoalteromonas sp. TaxID=53249 RepID=UPI001DECE63D|nr:hypothetical protein [Pseudoalteromonas sp.]NRA79855.1 hypothetical protein [Pseudoalteromonas sp.]
MSFDKKAFKKASNPFKPDDVIKGSLSADPGKVFKTGKSAKKRAQAKQSLFIEKQRQTEDLKLAEADDELARRKSLATSKKAGRRSLIKTSEGGAGRSTSLGGG